MATKFKQICSNYLPIKVILERREDVMSPLLLVAEHITHGIGTDFVFGLRSHGRPENIIPSKGKALALSHVSAMVFMVLALQFCLI